MARKQSSVLIRAIRGAERAIASGERKTAAILEGVEKAIHEASQATIDYAELRDPETLAEAPEQLVGSSVLALAVHFAPDPDGRGSEVRLIDNRVLDLPAQFSQRQTEEPS
jgi:pantothenate synthetase